MIDTSIPKAVAENMLSPHGVVTVRPIPPGMSGASVYQCQRASGDLLALKRWPDETGLDRIREVHQVMQRSKSCGCELVPTVHVVAPVAADRPETVFSHQQNHWDLTQWMPGEPATGVAASGVAANGLASLDQVRRGAAVIARFHASTRSLAVQHQSPPAVLTRLKRLGELETLVPRAIHIAAHGPSQQLSPELQCAVHDACQLIQMNWNQISLRISRSLSQYADQIVPIQYVLRDIHREHILFTDHKPTGLIDFDAVRLDTTATDLARWVGSFSVQTESASDGEMENVWDAALAGFHDQNPFIDGTQSELNVPLAHDLCFATSWISLANWLVWLLCQRRAFSAGPRVVAARVRELTAAATQGS